MKALQKTAISAAAVALLTGLTSAAVFAEEAAAPEVSPITANVTVASSYVYRGLTQTNNKPAIQGGFDYAHESGLYIGNWNSNISWISDGYGQSPSTTAPIEMDFYAGIKKELIGEGFASDLGVLHYFYPTNGIPNSNGQLANPNTTELYLAQNFTFGPLTGFGKVSYAVTTLFGNINSAGSYYPDLTMNYDTGVFGLALNGHIGYQYVAGNQPSGATGSSFVGGAGVSNNKILGYTDWKLGVTKDFGGGLSGSLAYVGTNAQTFNGYYAYASPVTNGATGGKNLGRSTGLVSLTKTF